MHWEYDQTCVICEWYRVLKTFSGLWKLNVTGRQHICILSFDLSQYDAFEKRNVILKKIRAIHGKSYAICLENENASYSTRHPKYLIIVWSAVFFNAMHCKCNITRIAFTVLYMDWGCIILPCAPLWCTTQDINLLCFFPKGFSGSILFWIGWICWGGWSQIRNGQRLEK